MDSRMNTQDCAWADIFDEQSRTNLKEGFIVTGILTMLLIRVYCMLISQTILLKYFNFYNR